MADSKRKTANLFDVNSKNTANGYINDAQLTSDGNTATWGSAEVSEYIPIKGNTDYTFNGIGSYNAPSYCLYDSDKQYISGQTYNGRSIITFTSPDNARFVRFTHIKAYTSAMFVEGSYTTSTMPVFEPYWQHSLRKLGTSTDTLTTLPADIYADGNNATVGLVGNMSQSGTPSPTNPIQPSECGDRTGNLWSDTPSSPNTSLNQNTGEELPNGEFDTYTIAVAPSTTYTMAFSYGSSAGMRKASVHQYNGNTWISALAIDDNRLYPKTVTTDSNATKIKISILKDTSNRRCNVGETALPYEPYGVKIPISSANTTTPVYLGEVQTTRRIKKYEFTGQENFEEYSNPSVPRIGVSIRLSDMRSNMRNVGYCSHFTPISSPSQNVVNGVTFGASNNYLYITFSTETAALLNVSDLTTIKAWFAAQYAAGTPVCVWYVLETPETGIVNEPLRKIGDYADEVSGITIPTIAGADSFDVQTTLKPSEVSLAYTGWHDATVKEWDGSEWQ